MDEVNVTLMDEKIKFSTKPKLTEADFIVSGGRGMEGADFSISEDLASVLGSAAGASRNAVDQWWRRAPKGK